MRRYLLIALAFAVACIHCGEQHPTGPAQDREATLARQSAPSHEMIPRKWHESDTLSAHPPELSHPEVMPDRGGPETEFKYEVYYYDRDGDPPANMEVHIKEGMFGVIAYDMNLKEGSPSRGTYCFATTLPITLYTYRYWFSCEDTTGRMCRKPESSYYNGPLVTLGEGKNVTAKVAVHVMEHDGRTNCAGNMPEILACVDIQTTHAGCSVDCFPVFYDLVEFRGFEYGMTWPDWTYSAVWTPCADVTDGEIRWPGDGVIQTWDECVPEHIAIPGWIWMYADGPGLVGVWEHPGSGEIRIYDCDGGTNQPIMTAFAGVCGYPGDDPCPP